MAKANMKIKTPSDEHEDDGTAVDQSGETEGYRQQGGTGETVTVCCKVPNGLLLRLFNMRDVDEPVYGGGIKTTKRAFVNTAAGQVLINGPAVEKGFRPRHDIAGGFALTPGVSKAFFEEWLRQNQSHPAVKNGMIFASPKRAEAIAAAKDNKANRSNQEPMHPVPEKDHRVPKRRGLKLEVATTKDD